MLRMPKLHDNQTQQQGGAGPAERKALPGRDHVLYVRFCCAVDSLLNSSVWENIWSDTYEQPLTNFGKLRCSVVAIYCQSKNCILPVIKLVKMSKEKMKVEEMP